MWPIQSQFLQWGLPRSHSCTITGSLANHNLFMQSVNFALWLFFLDRFVLMYLRTLLLASSPSSEISFKPMQWHHFLLCCFPLQIQVIDDCLNIFGIIICYNTENIFLCYLHIRSSQNNDWNWEETCKQFASHIDEGEYMKYQIDFSRIREVKKWMKIYQKATIYNQLICSIKYAYYIKEKK